MKKSLGAKIIVSATHVWAIGTYDSEDKPNMMTAAWGGVCCSQPPCVAVSLRKATYSYGNIVTRKAFTVNVPSADYLKQTDYVGIYSGKKWINFHFPNLPPSGAIPSMLHTSRNFLSSLNASCSTRLRSASTPSLSVKSWMLKLKNRCSEQTDSLTLKRLSLFSTALRIALITRSENILEKRIR